jgi:L-cystine uptake protein TcyP (sodium:dicarboxylate symporter family)
MEHAANRRIAGSIQDAVAKIDRSRRFGRCVTRRFPFTETYTSAAYVELLETHSDKRMLPPEQRAALCAAIGASLDRAGGQVVHPYVAEMVAAPVVK